MNDNLGPADLKAVLGNNNGVAYPVYAGNNNSGFGTDGGWLWLILILAIMNGGWGMGGFGGFGGGFGGMYEFPWLLTGQQGINANTNAGFDNLQLANQLTGINSGVQNLSTQLCNCCADINATVNSGFANAETAANARQMANMQQAFNNQISTLQGFNGVTNQVADASAENRLGIAGLNATILSENCADRAALQEGVRDIITNATSNTQAVLDKLCQLELDGKNEKIVDLQRQLTMADLRASQTAQNAFIAQGLNNEVDALYNRLATCPINTIPVYGNQRIFTCPNNNYGCGCNGNGNFI